jgi:predicted KAP-like P-loop ATPase
MVIALDGAWGSGKSFFLKCWVGAHKLENEGTATTVYFDALSYDYLDDPLVALTGAIDHADGVALA